MKKQSLFIVLAMFISIILMSCGDIGIVSPTYACIKLVDCDGNFIEDAFFSTSFYDKKLLDVDIELKRVTEADYNDIVSMDEKVFFDRLTYYTLSSVSYSKKVSNNHYVENAEDYHKNLNITISKDGYKTKTINAYSDCMNQDTEKNWWSFYFIVVLENE